jgi:hypothetical protein
MVEKIETRPEDADLPDGTVIMMTEAELSRLLDRVFGRVPMREEDR